jgi:hypothetical protein
MKLIYTTICLFVLAISCASCQPPPPPGAPAAQNRTSWETLNGEYNNPKIVLDEKWIPDSAVKRTLDELDPLAVVKIKVLHVTKSNERNSVYLTTATLKMDAYKKKFSPFSTKYAAYLSVHQNREGSFFYNINTKTLSGGRQYVVDVLYNIPAEKITSVDFMTTSTPDGAMISITTKQ